MVEYNWKSCWENRWPLPSCFLTKIQACGFPGVSTTKCPPPISLHLQVLTIHRAVIRASACHATLNCGHWISFFGQKVWVAVYDFFTKLEWNTPSCITMESTINLWICSLSHTGSTHASLLLSQYWSQLSFSAHMSLNKKHAQRSHSESYQHENYGLMVDRSPITSYI